MISIFFYMSYVPKCKVLFRFLPKSNILKFDQFIEKYNDISNTKQIYYKDYSGFND